MESNKTSLLIIGAFGIVALLVLFQMQMPGANKDAAAPAAATPAASVAASVPKSAPPMEQPENKKRIDALIKKSKGNFSRLSSDEQHFMNSMTQNHGEMMIRMRAGQMSGSEAPRKLEGPVINVNKLKTLDGG